MATVIADIVINFDQATDAVVRGARAYPAWVPGVAIALEEMGVPLPLPGDVLVAYLGYRMATGRMSLWEIVPQLLIGIVVGSLILFAASERWGHGMIDRYGFIWHLTERRRYRAERLTARWGFWSVAVGRQLGLRVPMTLMAGSFGMRRHRFAQSVMVSSILWLGIWLLVGARAGAQARDLLGHVSYGGVIAVVAIYVLVFVVPPLVHIARGHSARTRGKGPADTPLPDGPDSRE